jgi:hypothetical protein
VPRRVFRVPSTGEPFLDLLSAGRAGPHGSGGFTAAQIEQIRRTVWRTSEVMVKVTGGGATVGAVRAHVSYISQHGELRIATDEGQRVAHDSQNGLLKDWHLERSADQYREPRGQKNTSRTVKLVHNVVLSMPAPTPPEKVLAAARIFAREKFGLKHRYAMALTERASVQSSWSSLGGGTGDAKLTKEQARLCGVRGAAFRQRMSPRGRGHARSGHDSRGRFASENRR